jgi:hypothetical protein
MAEYLAPSNRLDKIPWCTGRILRMSHSVTTSRFDGLPRRIPDGRKPQGVIAVDA